MQSRKLFCQRMFIQHWISGNQQHCGGPTNILLKCTYELLTILGYQYLDPENPEHAVMMANLGRFGSMLTDFETANRVGAEGCTGKQT